MVNIITTTLDKIDLSDNVVVVGLAEDGSIPIYVEKNSKLNQISNKINSFGQTHLKNIRKYGKFMTLATSLDETPITILLVGLGELNKLNSDRIRHIGGLISLRCKELNFTRINILKFFSESTFFEPLIEGLVLSQYEFSKFKENKSEQDQDLSFSDNCNINIITDGSKREEELSQINKNQDNL